jgi:hypothetical protein
MNNDNENILAMEIAESLNDQKSLPLYLQMTQKYSPVFLRDKLREALAVPPEKVRKNRGALFTWMVKNHAKYQEFHSRD